MNWTQLPATPQTDAALRRAAAGVCGLVHRQPDGGNYYMMLHTADWKRAEREDLFLPDKDRNCLARVFVAARKQLTRTGGDLSRMWTMWGMALTDPRIALCCLLDLLGVPVPDELENQE